MPLINTAAKVYRGGTLATKVLQMSTQVWPAAYSDTVLGDNPYAYWRLDETAGLVADDAKDTLDASITDGTVILGEPGVNGKSYRFTNVTGYVRCGTVGALHGSSRAAFSAECWFKIGTVAPDSGQGVLGIFSTNAQNDGYANNAWDICMSRRGDNSTLGTTGPGQVFASVASGSLRIFAGHPIRLDDNQWHHAVMTFDGKVRLYIDGEPQGINVNAIGNANLGIYPAAIGLDYQYQMPSYPAEFFPGNIDEVAFYRHVLTPAQVAAHYYAVRPKPTPVAWLMEDPLSSMANLVTNGTGAYDVSSGVLNVNPVDGPKSRIRHAYAINPAHGKHIIQCDVRIPASFSTGTDNNIGIGFGTSSFSSGDSFAAARWASSTNRYSHLQDGVAWTDGQPFGWVAGQWYTFRVTWTPSNVAWKMYCDGVLMMTARYGFSATGKYPSLFAGRYQSSAAGYQFRNLKYWGGGLTDAAPLP